MSLLLHLLNIGPKAGEIDIEVRKKEEKGRAPQVERRKEEVGPSEKKWRENFSFFANYSFPICIPGKEGKGGRKVGNFFPFPPEWEARGGKGEEVEVEASKRIQTISAVSAVSRRKL